MTNTTSTTANTPAPPASPASDKRQAILGAARRLIARSGLHDTPMSAVAREAGVAAGTLYLYFPSKEAMIDALFLELLAERNRAFLDIDEERYGAREALWKAWHGLARWNLDHPDASNVLLQCQASGILGAATRDAERRMEADGLARFQRAVDRGEFRPVSRQVFWALFAGPIHVLTQMRDAREIHATDEELRAIFDGVCRSLLPSNVIGD